MTVPELAAAALVTDDTDRMLGQVRDSGGRSSKTGGMRILQYVVGGLLVVGLVVTSIGWYLSAHPGGERFESCHWEGSRVVLGYTYGPGDTVSTMVRPDGDHVVAQLRVDRAKGAQRAIALTGEARYPISGGPMSVRYPNGAELNCPAR
ncbi:MAG TPA: hypothetical protein VFQ01_02995 [Nocardioides sp.]|nr:hypothetical protein [Nocardioides sp.]